MNALKVATIVLRTAQIPMEATVAHVALAIS